MPNAFFEFKKFKIKQDKCAMKVGTDAVLLGAWANCENSKTILEIGTGTGVIALMLAQKSKAQIFAIDIDEQSTIQAKENVGASIYASQVQVQCISFQEFYKFNSCKFDLIVSNPPYFIQSLKNPNESKTLARHNDSLPFNEIILGAKKLLHSKGKLCLILPKQEAEIFRELATHNGLNLSKLLRIRTKKDKEIEKRHLMQFEFRETELSESTLIIEGENHREYTNEYKELTKEFYLHF